MPIPQPLDGPEHNRILAALPKPEMQDVRSALERVELEDGAILWESGEKVRYLYFPTTALISLQYENESGATVSIATFGRSGVIGTGTIGSEAKTPDRAVVILGGGAYRMTSAQAHNQLGECEGFHSLIMTYTTSLLTKISQNVICNRLHRVDQQLCRFLLDCRDDLQTDTLHITHDQMAGILGVRRESVSLAASELQKQKLIKTGRGKVHLLDPDGLEDAACECYLVAKDHLDKTLKQFQNAR